MQFKNSGKLKAITFSYDDGTTQDIQLVELLNKYNLKCTFNLNSDKLGTNRILSRSNGQRFAFYRLHADDIPSVYAGHEIAAHTLTHARLPELDDAEVIRQVEQDRLQLSELAGYEVVGMAYSCGGLNHDDRVVRLIQENTGIKYARTGKKTDSFDPQADLFRFKPNLSHISDMEHTTRLVRQFLDMETDKPQILYIYGHAFELDLEPDNWLKLDGLFASLSNRDDIFYGTNKEVLL